jgi:hypothetical protein
MVLNFKGCMCTIIGRERRRKRHCASATPIDWKTDETTVRTCTYALVIANDSALFLTLSFLCCDEKQGEDYCHPQTNDDDYDDEHQ